MMTGEREMATPKKSASDGTKRVSFVLRAPQATRVAVTGSFCDWTPEGYALKSYRGGVWRCNVFLAPGRYEYRFVVDGNWQNDPAGTEHVPNPFGSLNTVLSV